MVEHKILYFDPTTSHMIIPGLCEEHRLYLESKGVKNLEDVWSSSKGWNDPLTAFVEFDGPQIRDPEERVRFLNLLEILIDNLRLNPDKFIDSCPARVSTEAKKISDDVTELMTNIDGLRLEIARRLVMSGIKTKEELVGRDGRLALGVDEYYSKILATHHLSTKEALESVQEIMILKAYLSDPLIVPGPDKIGGP